MFARCEMIKNIEQKYIIYCVVFLLIFQTTSANDSSIPRTVYIEDSGYKTNYPKINKCDPDSIYYTYDGSCNNLAVPLQGKAFMPFKRYIEANYSDGIQDPYKDRPQPRNVSLSLFHENANTSLEVNVNMWFVIYGQFLIHDLALAEINDAKIKCCPKVSNETECMPIELDDDDEFQFPNRNCLDFVRSLGVGPIDGEPGPREQLNVITNYIDASMLYGSSKKELDSLRNDKTGKMIVTNFGTNPLLPTASKILPKNKCPLFRAGDNRVNENVILAVYHTIWVREHNLIVDKLKEIHPNWSTEELFQNARRIVIAETQHITYNEFLPLLVGDEIMQLYELYPDMYCGYNKSVDASISNAFTTAAFRYGHAMVDEFINYNETSNDYTKRNNTDICKKGVNLFSCKSHLVSMEDLLRNMDRLYTCENSIEASIRGSIEKNSQTSNDMKAAKSLTLNLRHNHDLISVNIQRGRDHGLPPYNDWRVFLGLDPIDFYYSDDHEESVLQKLQELYKDPGKIDLFVGGVLEKKLEGAVLGPTFANIIGMQFHDLKYGDRLWYERKFDEAQLEEIKSQTMSKLIMRNARISSLPIYAFFVPSEYNPDLPKSFSNFNFSAWS